VYALSAPSVWVYRKLRRRNRPGIHTQPPEAPGDTHA
jgi:hypothetical protein